VWQTVLALAGPLVAVPTSIVAVLAFRRTARVADVGAATAAQQVGLDYLKESLKAQQETITRQEGQIGELRGELRHCHTERETQTVQIKAQADQILAQAGQIAELQARLT
jgi:hypothetical protein